MRQKRNFSDLVRQMCAKRKNAIFILSQKVQETRLFDVKKRVFLGTPEGTRTPDLLVRSQSLYPTELPAHTALLRPNILPQGAEICKHFFLFFQKISQFSQTPEVSTS